MGRPTTPLSQFVLKVHSRCDLACDHCYVYQGADQSWRGQPMTMSDEVIFQTALRIAEHATAHRLATAQVVLHGGEPLMAGPVRLRRIIGELRAALRGICRLDLRIHTNGVLLDDNFCEMFAEHDVKVGISVDGDQAANDRHRRYANGRSSYQQVVRAIELLRADRFRELYAGLLCTIDVANDPVAVYEALVQHDPPRIDFLLPHATWDNPPVRPRGTDSEYADWLIAIFDRWCAAGRPVEIRTFASILSTLNGGDSLTEALGLTPSGLVVIETDGSYEQADSLKTAFDGAPATGFDVFRHSLDAVGQHPGITARQQGSAGLCQTCQECPVVASCGGGLYAHRYRAGTEFGNPSVFCPDLLKLITYIRGRLPLVAARRPESHTHAMSDADFRALAAGFGEATAIEQLTQAQRSLRRPLLGAVYQAAVPFAAPPLDGRLRAAWTMLTRLDEEQPEALDAVLGHPYVRVWSVRCLQQLQVTSADSLSGGQARIGGPLESDLGHLGAIAVATAIRAGVSVRMAIPIVAGAVHLPTLGRLAIGREETAPISGHELRTATVDVTGDALTIRTSEDSWTLAVVDLLAGKSGMALPLTSGGLAEWQPVRRLRAPGISVALEDTDPYRDCHQWQAAPRLTDSEFARWQRSFGEAWQEIRREHDHYAPALAAGLDTLMPLSAAPPGRDVSAAARQAFGAIAVARPDDPVTLALLLIHEFQHVKLGAVLDLYDLFDPADDRLFHAPWRDDPRPLEGLLQGTYAHLAVTDFWRARREASAGPAAVAAGQRFAHWRAHTSDAIETLASSGSLTPLGLEFLGEMRHSVCS